MAATRLETVRPAAGTVLTPLDCQRILNDLKPFIGNYDWIWRIIQSRARRRNDTVPWNTYRRLKPFFNPRKPYFIYKTYSGMPYLGHCEDAEALLWMVKKDQNVDMINFMANQLSSADGAFLDIGANIGLISTAMHHLVPEREIIAVEAVPETAMRAAATFALNNIQNIKLYVCAMGDADCPLEIQVSPTQSGQSSLHAVDNFLNRKNLTVIQVNTVSKRANSELASLPKIGLMKIDVEGHEPNVISGATDLITRDLPKIVYEYNPVIPTRTDWKPADLNRTLSDRWGYACYALEDEKTPTPLVGPDRFINCYCTTSSDRMPT